LPKTVETVFWRQKLNKEEILSQEEIDALMNVFSKKTLEDEALSETELTGTEVPNDESAFRSYASPRYPRQASSGSEKGDEIEHKDGDRIDENFEKLEKPFERICELFSHSLVSSLSGLLRHDVTLNNFVVEKPVAYEDFLASMNNPSCIGIFTPGISRITALLELNLNLAYSIIDIMLGGKGENSLKSVRALTDLELNFMRKPMEEILGKLDEYLNLESQLEEVYTYPSQININSSRELVVPIAFEIMAEESTTGDETIPSKPIQTITFCIPRTAMESEFSNQNNASIDLKEKDEYLEAIKKSTLTDVPLCLQAHFPKAEVTIGKLMEMKTGEIIVLDMHQDDDVIEVDLLVEECPKFKGKLGAIGRYKAVAII